LISHDELLINVGENRAEFVCDSVDGNNGGETQPRSLRLSLSDLTKQNTHVCTIKPT